MKVGLNFSSRAPLMGPLAAVDLARSIAADSLWTVDHLMGTMHPVIAEAVGSSDPDAFYDPFCLLTALGRDLPMPVGTCVTDTIRRSAADLARTAFTLSELCPAGFNLGLGCGEAENLIPFGYDFTHPVSRTEQVLMELRQLLDEGSFPHTSGRLGLQRVTTAIPRVWLAAHGPRMLRLTGTYADGWLPAFISGPAEYSEKLGDVSRSAAAASRPRPEAGFQPFVIIGESLEHLEQQFRRQPLAKLFTLFGTSELWSRHGLEHPAGPQAKGFLDVVVHDLNPDVLRELAPTIPFALVREMIILGNVDEITAQVEPYTQAGVEHLVIGNMTGLVGGGHEAARRAPDFLRLAQMLRGL